MRVFFTLAALAVIAVTACTGVKAQEAEVYSIRIGGVASDGVMVPPTPTPTAVIVPTTTPAGPVVVAAHWNPDVERWRPLVASIFPGWAVSEALEVIHAESRGDPDVYNFQGSGACGLFQLLPCETTDPEGNVRGAYRKWLDGGQSFWKHWYRWW